MDSDSPLAYLYTGLVNEFLTNLEGDETITDADGNTAPALTLPALISYNKDSEDGGFAAPVTAISTTDGIDGVFTSYLSNIDK